MAKWRKVDMGSYAPSIEDMEAYVWCIRNKIYIAPQAVTDGTWTIAITNNGKTNLDPKRYVKVHIWIKVYEYYKYYYEKHISKR